MKLLTRLKLWKPITIPLDLSINNMGRRDYIVNQIVQLPFIFKQIHHVFLYPEKIIIDVVENHYWKYEYSISKDHSALLKRYLAGEIIPQRVNIVVKQQLERTIS